MGRPLGIDFSWILLDFEGQVEPSWHGKSSQDRSKKTKENTMKKKKASWRRLGSVLERLGILKIHGCALTPLTPLAVAGTQNPLLRIP